MLSWGQLASRWLRHQALDALQLLFDLWYTSGSLFCVHPHHTPNQRAQFGRDGRTRQGRKEKRGLRGVAPCEQVMQGGPQTEDVGLRGGLCCAVLLGGGVAS